jgi:hypothetical protein
LQPKAQRTFSDVLVDCVGVLVCTRLLGSFSSHTLRAKARYQLMKANYEKDLLVFIFLYAGSLYEYTEDGAYPERQQEHARQE